MDLFIEMADSFFELVGELISMLVVVAFGLLFIIAMPIWILPYIIYKRSHK
jgi:hypothetical protein